MQAATMDPRYEWFTGEPDAVKVASPVREGARDAMLLQIE